jgi:hypothetical protein
MGIRSTGFNLPQYTTAQLTAYVAAYGPAGTTQVNGLQAGSMAYNTTTNTVVVFNGTTFVTVTVA